MLFTGALVLSFAQVAKSKDSSRLLDGDAAKVLGRIWADRDCVVSFFSDCHSFNHFSFSPVRLYYQAAAKSIDPKVWRFSLNSNHLA